MKKENKKGFKRGKLYWIGYPPDSRNEEFQSKSFYLRRNTTKLCSCEMCKNHSFKSIIQEKEYKNQFITDLNDYELMNLGLNSIQSLLSKDWNSSEDDVFNNI